MTENELSELLQSGENIPIMARYFTDHPELLPALMNIAADDRENSTWRAFWIADKIHEQQPDLIVPFLPAITDLALTTQNSSKKRHLLKLISLHDIPPERMAPLLNFCLDLFTNAMEAVAVRVHAMQILFNIALKEPEFTGELADLIEHEIEYFGSAGISSRGRKLLRELRKIGKPGQSKRQ